ncbi:hypothetical protein J4220_02505 [Candidatus Micrarchaeota archaeon]|nr:hypothetical protein [Candidatus Micrarchaeota archaeon]
MDFKQHLILLRKAFEKSNIPELKRLSGEFAGDAFIHYRKENIQMSIIAYACAKFLEKPYILADPAWDSFRKSLLSLLEKALQDWSSGKQAPAFAKVAKALSLIERLGADLGRFVFGIIEKAKLKAGAEIYAHGASLGTAAELSGAEKKELSSYIAATRMPEKYVTKSVAQRMQDAKKIFS